MEVVEGSHTQIHRHVPSEGSNLLANSQEIAVAVDPESATAIGTPPKRHTRRISMGNATTIGCLDCAPQEAAGASWVNSIAWRCRTRGRSASMSSISADVA